MRDWFAARTKRLQISGIRKMFEMAGPDSINLGLGELDFQPSEKAMNALAEAVKAGYNRYGPTRGIPELRTVLAERLTRYRPDVEMENIIITAGGTQGLMVTAMTLFDHGDEVLTPDPGFVIYQPHVIMCGATPLRYSLKFENDFQPNPDEIQELITPRTKAIIINSPNNPTSGILTPETIKALRDIAVDNEMVIISDEVYDEIIFEGEHHSMLNPDYDNVVYVNSFSKTFAVTGWRLGYLASSKYMVNQLAKIQYYNIACPPTPLQKAIYEVMKAPTNMIHERVGELTKRRDAIVKRCNDIPGFSCLKPNGAFYVFPSFDQDISSEDFAMELVKNNLICAPGSAFGKGGEGHLRFSFANSLENIEKGMDIVEKVARGIPRKK
ncbi:MAG: pyridoxal phosphate-dependent aminotransferase [Candidatus Thermoplasmatota archaeon]|nr:pyridoxal phosphate-dependent aminotransferase [Candidatus Thermoplasmatota archaeon]MBU4144114.1 pyridoxal phosphate-dependent aminotransferase [Candidatus Thermoplasmatota archaeon]MBU4591993.1 pyridoxal phosphate-dependent aminotransferase [Candidatus Thermoplasmatota archaeon]